MSDTMDEGLDEQDQQDNLRELREAAARGKEAKADADAARRELAFAKAGIDTDSPKGKMFVKAYDGELDGAAIKAQFEELFGTPQAASEETGDTPEEEARQEALRQQTAERRDLTAQGADHQPPPAPDMVEQAFKEFDTAVSNGQSRDIAFRHVMSGMIAAANAEQPGAVWTGWTDEQLDSGMLPTRR